ncbi:hypothetical protein KI387_010077, partial [Taxus chinensis]
MAQILVSIVMKARERRSLVIIELKENSTSMYEVEYNMAQAGERLSTTTRVVRSWLAEPNRWTWWEDIMMQETMLSWSVLEFGGFKGTELSNAKAAIRWATYYLLKDTSHLGTIYVQASLDDQERVVDALKQVDVVISALSGGGGGGFLRHHILEQLKLVEAIKVAGNIKRFLPSEFGMDPDILVDALEPGNITFSDKRKVRRAIEAAAIPHTYVSANMFAGFFAGSLAQSSGRLMPPPHQVLIYGDGNVKGIWVDEDDVGIYTIKTIDDPRTLNKTLYIRPPLNILSQKEMVEIWERLSGKSLEKTHISSQDFLAGLE